jgi:hypothetical protein
MSVYAVTFRIEYDSQSRYDKVYEGLTAAIRGSTSSKYWDDPTSFYLITSDLSPKDLASRLVTASHFDEDKDHLLVINLSSAKGSAHRGKLIDQDLVSILSQR